MLIPAARMEGLTTTFAPRLARPRLVLGWTNSVEGAWFRVDVVTPIAAAPLPATILRSGAAPASPGRFG